MKKYLCGLNNCVSSLTKEYDTLVGAVLVSFLFLLFPVCLIKYYYTLHKICSYRLSCEIVEIVGQKTERKEQVKEGRGQKK